MQKYGEFMEIRFRKIEHGSEMRLLKTRSHTSRRRDYEVYRERKAKRKDERPLRNGQENRQRKPPPYNLKEGAGRECVDGKGKEK